MAVTASHRKILYQYEVLRARLAIREHYVKTIVREVYENIGQVLSLVRVQLTLLDTGAGSEEKEKIDSSGKLVGSAIRDLRSMCQRFQPETAITTTPGLNTAIEQEIKIAYPEAVYKNKVQDMLLPIIRQETALILFSLLLEVLAILKESVNREVIAGEINYLPGTMLITIKYRGETVKKERLKEGSAAPDLPVAGRIKLLKGSLQVKSSRNGEERIKLVIPIN